MDSGLICTSNSSVFAKTSVRHTDCFPPCLHKHKYTPTMHTYPQQNLTKQSWYTETSLRPSTFQRTQTHSHTNTPTRKSRLETCICIICKVLDWTMKLCLHLWSNQIIKCPDYLLKLSYHRVFCHCHLFLHCLCHFLWILSTK